MTARPKARSWRLYDFWRNSKTGRLQVRRLNLKIEGPQYWGPAGLEDRETTTGCPRDWSPFWRPTSKEFSRPRTKILFKTREFSRPRTKKILLKTKEYTRPKLFGSLKRFCEDLKTKALKEIENSLQDKEDWRRSSWRMKTERGFQDQGIKIHNEGIQRETGQKNL